MLIPPDLSKLTLHCFLRKLYSLKMSFLTGCRDENHGRFSDGKFFVDTEFGVRRVGSSPAAQRG